MGKIILFLLALIIFVGCGGGADADISAYGADPIIISGLKDSDFIITPDEINALESVTRNASGITAIAGTMTAEIRGPLLETFLQEYGFEPSDFDIIRFFARDDYRIALRSAQLMDYEIILGVSAGSEPLIEMHQPLRLILPGSESHLWIHAVNRIEFVLEEQPR